MYSTVVETPQKLSPGIDIIKVCLIVATIGSMILSPALSSTYNSRHNTVIG
jgi:hypothetical protein